jgi:release factor glutamine methyltransferase
LRGSNSIMFDKIRRQFRRFTQPFFWKVYKFYLSRNRFYRYENLMIHVMPSVFHPGLLFSTKILLRFILRLDLENKNVLELGAGSGLIAAAVCREGAIVTATDINPAAIESMSQSKTLNNLDFSVINSDIFDDLDHQLFDFIFINPPYFRGKPQTDREKAFFCGNDFEFFHRLFSQINDYISKDSSVYMILSDDCEIEKIKKISEVSLLNWELVHQQLVWGETNFIFKLSL